MLLKWALGKADSELQKLSAFHMLSSILNRRADGKNILVLDANTGVHILAELSLFLSDKLDRYWSDEIASPESALPRRKWAITSWIWVSRCIKF